MNMHMCMYVFMIIHMYVTSPSRRLISLSQAVGSACHLILNLALILASPLHLAVVLTLTLALECVAWPGWLALVSPPHVLLHIM